MADIQPMAAEQAHLTPSKTYKSGLRNLRRALAISLRDALRPPPELSPSEWANTYGYLSPETSASPGRFVSFRYQDGIMDAVTDPTVKQITVMKSARIGYTKCLDHVVGYFIHQDPSPILIVQPRVEDAEDYSRTEIAPMLRDTPVLASITGDLKAKDSAQRIEKRMFRNGASVSFVGANSPGGFRRITARIVCFDEIDGYPPEGAGLKGDQITLGTKRSESFWNRKIILGSTPTMKNASRIERAFNESDQRRYYVPCPHCGHEQILKWENLRWDKDEGGKHAPETAHFVCEGSGCIIEEHDKPGMIDAGHWRAERAFSGHAGFHIWAGYSLFPNACWANLVSEFLRVKSDPVLLRTFVNLVLGETWEEDAETVEVSGLASRGENYTPDTIPDVVQFLTSGIDVQADRLELHVLGFGVGEECWAVDYEILHGDPAQGHVWGELDKLLLGCYHTETGREMRIRAACIDTGGHHTNQVHAFCRARRARRIYPIQEASGSRPIWPKRFSRTKTNNQLFIVGADTAKDAIYGRLRIIKPGPGYIHFPVVRPENAFNETYFDQLTAEKVITRYRFGRAYRQWELPSGKRNEALDTFVYALAARMSLPVRLDVTFPASEETVPIPDVVSSPMPDDVVPPQARHEPQSNWLDVPRGWL